MTKPRTIKTVCPYCGVGCGVEAVVEDPVAHKVRIGGDPNHPGNFGKLCSKGAALGDTVSRENRLLYPELGGRRVDWNSALDAVADGLSSTIRRHGRDAIAFYVSGQLLTEDYYVANKLMKGYIGSANIDTNSRLCMSSAVVGYKRAFGADTVPGNYEDLELAELIVLAGSNAAWCHPVMFQRIRKAKEQRPHLKIVVIDPRVTPSCDIADLHLPIKPGTDAVLFNGLLTYLAATEALDGDYIDQHTEGFAEALASAQNTAPDIASVAAGCGLPATDIATFYQWFAGIARAVTAYSQGINQSGSGSDKCNAIINCHLATGKIGRPGTGPFSITGQPNAMGGREVGGMANMLAAHMDLDNATHRDKVQRFWRSPEIADRAGLKTLDLFEAIDRGTIKAVWIMATNPVVTLPDADRFKQALKRCELVIVSDCIDDTDTVELAQIKLPATGWSEKDGTVTNMERRISRQRPLFEPSGEAKPDWWIISQVAARMGFADAFDYRCSADVFKEHAALSGFENTADHGRRDFDISALADLSRDEFDRLQPLQWPITPEYPQGTARMFGDNRYFTDNGKANFIAVIPRPPVNAPGPDYPFTLNTGRVRDQWHTMTRTALSARLNSHKPEPFVEIHPDDAAPLNLPPRSLAKIESRWGSMIARVDITEHQQPGNLFVPMHWTGRLSRRGRVGPVVNPVVDPHSGQPESKQTPVSISAYRPKWYAMILSRHPLRLDAMDYRVNSKGDGFIRYEIAAESPPFDWPHWSRSLMGAAYADELEWLEYADPGAGYYRCAGILDNRLQCCLFTSPSWQLPDPGWLATLFDDRLLDRSERLRLLGARPPAGRQDIGRIVCSCFSVGERMIVETIQTRQLDGIEQIGRCLHAGTGCGSCLPELKALLSHTLANQANTS